MMNRLIYLGDVVTLKLDAQKCTGCGMCLLVCPHAVLSLANGKIQIVSRDACMECGACARNCPAEALNVRTGVGCAAAVINGTLGRKESSCCCTTDSEEKLSGGSECSPRVNRTDCG
jgi:ferredoxin